ncbi:diaminopimelate epimerase [Halomonas llamarensis]|uniref:Diaminopimelate epimerase n=1 Tax=Halomonas llamarensis TaxID=2945104 RepID=A0ABT0SLP1_9GAMM|nr:diaminopimelate epimerase [Halomonas llamarensis]MCL7928718.1 diaminopimelate epimerase [Halomonas llamarensis]
MLLHFTKMHGLGNDFVMVDLVTQRARLTDAHVRELSDRRFGIGFDQLLVVEPPRDPDMDFRYRIFNADGSEVENCGNGARCFARFVRDQRLTHKNEIHVETGGGPLVLTIQHDGQVRVDMGRPRFTPSALPFDAPGDKPLHELDVDGEALNVSVVSMGNPHAVLAVENVDSAPVARLGPAIEAHPRFPHKVNVGFMQVVSPSEIRLRVFERGSGETLACGTGACAAVASGIRQGLLKSPVNVHLPGGELSIEWPDPEASLIMVGPATRVFDGRVALN